MFKLDNYIENGMLFYKISNRNNILEFTSVNGAVITRWVVNDDEILYLNKKKLNDSSRVKGGIPFLFPITGRLKNNKYKWNNKEYKMGIHGFNYLNDWKVEEINLGVNAEIIMSFQSNHQTKKCYPFDFELIIKYILSDSILNIENKIINKSEEKMPLYTGFHPYFRISKKENINYVTYGKKYLDYKDMKVKKYNNLMIENNSYSKIILDNHKNKASFYDKEKDYEIKIRYSRQFKYLVLWTEKNKKFICIEPWMALPDAFNSKEDLKYIKAGTSLKTNIRYEYN